MTKALRENILQHFISALLLISTGIVLLSPQVPLIRKVSEYSVHMMLLMLGIGMTALVFNKTKVMFAGLASCGALCIFLQNASNADMKLPDVNTDANISVAQVNLSNLTFDATGSLAEILELNSDVISVQELTPDWSSLLENTLSEKYPYKLSDVRIDPYGMAMYSKTPLLISDTFMVRGKPNLNIIVKKEQSVFQIVSSYLTPALDEKSVEEASTQLDVIGNRINDSEHPVIALGEYNMVYWTYELRQFMDNTKLKNSRRDIARGNLRVPHAHIFFSAGLECTSFEEIRDNAQNYLGIMGMYQVKVDKDLTSIYSSQNQALH